MLWIMLYRRRIKRKMMKRRLMKRKMMKRRLMKMRRMKREMTKRRRMKREMMKRRRMKRKTRKNEVFLSREKRLFENHMGHSLFGISYERMGERNRSSLDVY